MLACRKRVHWAEKSFLAASGRMPKHLGGLDGLCLIMEGRKMFHSFVTRGEVALEALALYQAVDQTERLYCRRQ